MKEIRLPLALNIQADTHLTDFHLIPTRPEIPSKEERTQVPISDIVYISIRRNYAFKAAQ
jgi:hypothetical protein